MSRLYLAIGSLTILAIACSFGASDSSEQESPEEGPSGGVPISKSTPRPVEETDEAPVEQPQPTSPPQPSQPAPTESSPSADPTPPGLPDLSDRALQIVNLNVIDRGDTGVVVVGLVENTTQNDMGKGDVYFTFLDENGQEVSQKTTLTAMQFIPPGDISPFRQGFPPEVPTGAEYVVVDTGFRNPPSSIQYVRDGLEFTQTGETEYPNAGYEAMVDVRNNTGKTITWLNVVAMAFDANGVILGFGSTAPDIDPLAPGGSLPYEITIPTGTVTDQIERIEFIADARIQEP